MFKTESGWLGIKQVLASTTHRSCLGRYDDEIEEIKKIQDSVIECLLDQL